MAPSDFLAFKTLPKGNSLPSFDRLMASFRPKITDMERAGIVEAINIIEEDVCKHEVATGTKVHISFSLNYILEIDRKSLLVGLHGIHMQALDAIPRWLRGGVIMGPHLVNDPQRNWANMTPAKHAMLMKAVYVTADSVLPFYGKFEQVNQPTSEELLQKFETKRGDLEKNNVFSLKWEAATPVLCITVKGGPYCDAIYKNLKRLLDATDLTGSLHDDSGARYTLSYDEVALQLFHQPGLNTQEIAAVDDFMKGIDVLAYFCSRSENGKLTVNIYSQLPKDQLEPIMKARYEAWKGMLQLDLEFDFHIDPKSSNRIPFYPTGPFPLA